jgi:hypothetical protein
MWVMWVVCAIVLLFGFVVFRGAPYVPSQKRYVKQALSELYPLSDTDTLVDVGSGDGVVLRVASRFGARAVGYELNPALVAISRILSHGDERVTVHLADFWLTKMPDETTVVYGFMVTRDMPKMVKKMQKESNRLNHTIHFLTYGNEIAGLKPDRTVGGYHRYAFHPLHAGKA